MNKRAALSLSVNAIIIFVLAFAMLGVGIFVTNELRGAATGGLKKASELIESIEEEPSSADPLVGIGKELDISAKGTQPLGIKLYNKNRIPYADAIVVLDDCKGTSTDLNTYSYAATGTYPVTVVSATVTIEASTFESIPLTIQNEDLLSGETYICKLKVISETEVVDGEDGSLSAPYFSQSFFLNVVS